MGRESDSQAGSRVWRSVRGHSCPVPEKQPTGSGVPTPIPGPAVLSERETIPEDQSSSGPKPAIAFLARTLCQGASEVLPESIHKGFLGRQNLLSRRGYREKSGPVNLWKFFTPP
jgi:hypothetical protein